MWFPLLPLETIYKHLAAEPHSMRPWEIKKMDRDTIFALYLRPKRRPKPPQVPPTFRAIWFAHGRKLGKTWLEIETDWQRQHAERNSRTR